MINKNHSNVISASILLVKKSLFNHTLHQFMKNKNHSNVICVSTLLFLKTLLKYTLHQFMKNKNHSNVLCASTLLRENILDNTFTKNTREVNLNSIRNQTIKNKLFKSILHQILSPSNVLYVHFNVHQTFCCKNTQCQFIEKSYYQISTYKLRSYLCH